LGDLVAEQRDATLAEYADRLAARAGICVSLAVLCVWLRRLGLRRKKSAPGERAAASSLKASHILSNAFDS
jgi:transposase